MAHPKHKLSKQRRDKRRTHDHAAVPTLSVCPNCGATVMYHRVCPECGYYRGRQIIEKSAEESALFFGSGPVVQRIDRKFPKL